ncbi:MAG: hypothetical protein J6A05_01450 [Oscillospiraceae bacterium]|nr:hypothetical protein [Oscillospiraceae bacterium]
MGTKLEKILEDSQKGYIDNKADVDEIIPRVANMKLCEIACQNRETLLKDVKVLMEAHNMSTVNLQTVTYREVLCLLDAIPNLEGLQYEMDIDERNGLRTEYIAVFRCAVLTAGRRVGAIKLFLSVTVKSYLEHFAEKVYKVTGVTELFPKLQQKMKEHADFVLTEKTTIQELLKTLEKVQCAAWIQSKPIAEYENQLRSCGEIQHSFIVGHFLTRYCETISDMKKKYSKFNHYMSYGYEK